MKRRRVRAAAPLFVLAVLLAVFRESLPEIVGSLRLVPTSGTAALLLLGFLYEGMDAALCFALARERSLSLPHAWRATMLGVFARVATFSAGTLPIQSHYLFRQGIDAGSALGLMGSVYILRKSAIVLYAALALLLGGGWLRTGAAALTPYIRIGCVLSVCVILALTLLYTCKPFLRVLLSLVDALPDTPQWTRRRESWRAALKALNEEAGQVLLRPTNSLRGIALGMGELFVLCSIPYLCLRLLGADGLRFAQVQLLSAVMLLITGALPNVAGMGSAEFAFLLVFSGYVGEVTAASALVLYRIATYFAPFLLGALVFLRERRRSGGAWLTQERDRE